MSGARGGEAAIPDRHRARLSASSLPEVPAHPTMRPWRVFHAAEYVRDVLPVVEGQLAVGMRPSIVTPQGFGSGESYLRAGRAEKQRPASLLRAWQDVRNWRKSLLECDPHSQAEVMHAHSFPSGMAAVRSFSSVVYDVRHFVEESDGHAHPAETGSWMARSFRVAEQFVLARAEATVVHSEATRTAAIERGAPAENLFVIPEPIDQGRLEHAADPVWLKQVAPDAGECCLVFAADVHATVDDGKLSESARRMLRAFVLVQGEAPQSRLLLVAEDRAAADALRREAAEAGAGGVVALHEVETGRAIVHADIVVATGADPRMAMEAMANGRTVLAADVPGHRELTPEGRGLLWFRADDEKDLAHRAGFLAGNPDFRLALGQAGQSQLLESRSMAAVGQRYHQVYEHAHARKKQGNAGAPHGQLQPLQAFR